MSVDKIGLLNRCHLSLGSRKRRNLLSRLAPLLLILVLGAALLPTVIPANRRYVADNFYCTQCGRLQSEHVTEGANHVVLDSRSETSNSSLSEWYADRFTEDCSHTWEWHGHYSAGRFELGIIDVPAGASQMGHRRGPRILYLDDQARAVLESKYREDPEVCREYLRQQLEPDE